VSTLPPVARTSEPAEGQRTGTLRPFRFATGCFEEVSKRAWAEHARRAEALGYAVFLVADHVADVPFAPVPALVAAADATTSIRVGCTVFCNDYRHPALLAKEAATVDVLTDGRFEFGLGAGWLKWEHDQAGIPFDPPGVRVARMEEALRVIKALWAGEPVHHRGDYYAVAGLAGTPLPVQRPHPPVFIGGGGKRLLSVAAREADIVGLLSRARPSGGIDWAEGTEEALARKVGWVREAAGERLGQIELALLLQGTAVTDRPQAAAAELAPAFDLTAEQVLASTEFAVGSVDQIVERLCRFRAEYGISYVTVFPEAAEAFAPVVARLAGT
jgi:probable F420-dependent oxidoreductase